MFVEAGADKDTQQQQRRDGTTALMLAAEYGRVEIARLLLEAGADEDLQNQDGKTALMLAVESGHAEIARLLLEAGADKDLQDQLGHTAVMLATLNNNMEMARMLLEAGAGTIWHDFAGLRWRHSPHDRREIVPAGSAKPQTRMLRLMGFGKL